ncbi:MAG: hypothetical protein LAT76_11920 [Schleiferiaceae bacterium]|nr:hypothetical protein [Schleiferiaceae bacterium]
MKKVIYYAIGVLLITGSLSSCDEDDDATNGPGGTTPAFESVVRITEGPTTGDIACHAIFYDMYFDAFEKNALSFDLMDNINITEANLSVGISLYSDASVFDQLIEGVAYTFHEQWTIGGPEDEFGIGVTWRDGAGNTIHYTDVYGGEITFEEISNNRVKATFSFIAVSPATSDTIVASNCTLIANRS